jgi:hypothetical protein
MIVGLSLTAVGPSMTPNGLESVGCAPSPSVEHEGIRQAAIAPVLLGPRMEFVSSSTPRAEHELTVGVAQVDVCDLIEQREQFPARRKRQRKHPTEGREISVPLTNPAQVLDQLDIVGIQPNPTSPPPMSRNQTWVRWHASQIRR